MLKEALSRMANVFSPANLLCGQEYQQEGHVLNIRLSDGLLKARVKGNQSQIYDVYIDLRAFPKVPAHCNCPLQINCEHAAASLLTLQVKENISIEAPLNAKTTLSLTGWLDSIRQQQSPKSTKSHELYYLLEPSFRAFNHSIHLDLALAKRLLKGKIAKKNIITALNPNKKQHFSTVDKEIVASLLTKIDTNRDALHFSLRDSELIERILQTNKAYLKEEDESLRQGETLAVELAWELGATGKQHLILKSLDNRTIKPLLLDKAWYFDEEEWELGLLESSYRLRELYNFLNEPPLDFSAVKDFYEEQIKIYPHFPKPKFYDERAIQSVKPIPIILFDALELEENEYLLVADLIFDYEGIKVKLGEEKDALFYNKGNNLIEIKPDVNFEEDCQKKLNDLVQFRNPESAEVKKAFYDISKELILADFSSTESLKDLYQDLIPKLKRNGFHIEFNHPLYEEPINTDDLEWFSDIKEGTDFFAYQLGIFIEGKEVNIVPLVVELIQRIGKDSLDTIDDEEQVKLSLSKTKALYVRMKRIKPLLTFLLEYGLRYIDKDKPLHLSPYQLILMKETEEAMLSINARWPSYELFKKKLEKLVNFTSLPLARTPNGLKADLRDYQLQGVSWLQFLREASFGGILADDMGLGKTVQTLAHLQLEKEEGRLTKPCLIISPTSLVGNWFEEALRFTPQLKVLIFHGATRHQDDFTKYDIVLSTYGLIQRDKSRFIEHSFYYLILDEAQSIKNARTKTTQIIHQLKAEHRLCLSGTPLENHLGELWSLFHFLMPGLLSDAKTFRQFFRTPIEKFNEMDKKMLLAKRLKPFMLRRRKQEVIKELPAKTEITLHIELGEAQRDIYEAIRMSMEKKVREAIAKQGLGKSHIVLLDALLKLRQICCDPRLLSLPQAKMAHQSSAKLNALMELLDNLMEEKRTVLVFSQFTSMLKLIENELIKRNYAYLKLTGQTQNRQALVHQFQEGKAPIFLISLKAGGTGLNLTQSDTVIHYDPWWNPAVEEQATDRSHRIGQKNPVFVYKLITTGTVEEAIVKMQDKKRELFEGVLADNAQGLVSLTPNDIEQFFKPLS